MSHHSEIPFRLVLKKITLQIALNTQLETLINSIKKNNKKNNTFFDKKISNQSLHLSYAINYVCPKYQYRICTNIYTNIGIYTNVYDKRTRVNNNLSAKSVYIH